MSTIVVSRVAEKTGVAPTALEPLYGVIDPDALDKMVDAEFGGEVQFEYAGCEVEVFDDETVQVSLQRDSATDDSGTGRPSRDAE